MIARTAGHRLGPSAPRPQPAPKWKRSWAHTHTHTPWWGSGAWRRRRGPCRRRRRQRRLRRHHPAHAAPHTPRAQPTRFGSGGALTSPSLGPAAPPPAELTVWAGRRCLRRTISRAMAVPQRRRRSLPPAAALVVRAGASSGRAVRPRAGATQTHGDVCAGDASRAAGSPGGGGGGGRWVGKRVSGSV
jgi:hypothetical protein